MAKVQLLGTFGGIVPGQEYTVYGHKFTAYSDGSLIGDIDPGFLPSGIAAGRYRLVDELKIAVKHKELKIDENDRIFAERTEELFKGLDFDSLSQHIETAHNKQVLFDYIEKRHGVSLPPLTKRQELIDEIIRLFKLEAGITN